MDIRNVLIERIDYLHRSSSTGERNAQVEQAVQPVDESKNAMPSKEQIRTSVEDLNQAVKQFDERLSFSYNDKVNRIVVKVIDSETNEVIREIPPRDIIRLAENIQEYLGMFIDESR